MKNSVLIFLDKALASSNMWCMCPAVNAKSKELSEK
jgi:hypothetical protein